MMELGRQSAYISNYTPELLFPIPRQDKRHEIGLSSGTSLPFFGYDIWNHYEVSWLNSKGKPMVALVQIIYDCRSPFIIESKSMKLYFNSFNQTKIQDIHDLKRMITHDISQNIQAPAEVHLFLLNESCCLQHIQALKATCIDDLDISCSEYVVNPKILKTHPKTVTENLYSNLLKSNCLVTLQPDWGSIEIQYTGPQIDKASLLRYIVSFRNHNEFHEQCIERIFVDLLNYCTPQDLTVIGRYTRRGGLDINPIRSTNLELKLNPHLRLIRQ